MQPIKNQIHKPQNSITTNLTINTMNRSNATYTQEQIPQQQNYHTGESSQTHNQNTHQNIPPQYFVYPETIIQEGVQACSKSILGKIITDKTIYASSIQNGLESIWGAPQGLKVQEIEGKILQFFMDKEEDQERILQGNPWIFRNSWLIIKPWDRETDPQSLDFNHVPIWVQLWGLPQHCKTKSMGESLGSLMGKVESSEVYEYPGKKVIIKIKVHIDVQKPIPSGIHVGNPNDGSCWIDFRYEKLPLVCFKCGLVGHVEKLCKNPPMELGTLAPLGPWIRSTQYGRRKMEAKDRKFYSNPSHNPKFGQYSPTVPTSLLDQLAAMKLQKTTTADSKHPKDPPDNTHYNQHYNHDHNRMIINLGGAQRMDTNGTPQDTTTRSSNNSTQITPAKRQKMETEAIMEAQNSQLNQPGVGSAQQASPMQ
jgi:hypothetical protein